MIDGQQRVVTCFILFTALRNYLINEKSDSFASDDINRKVLQNRNDKMSLRLKSIPNSTKNTDEQNSFTLIWRNKDISSHKDNVAINYKEIYSWIKENDFSYIDIKKGLEKMIINATEFKKDDSKSEINVHQVFESINSLGKGLTPVDLIRNYLLMNFKDSKVQDEMFEEYLKEIDGELNDSKKDSIKNINVFYRSFLVYLLNVRVDNEKMYNLLTNTYFDKKLSEEKARFFLQSLNDYYLIYKKIYIDDIHSNNKYSKIFKNSDYIIPNKNIYIKKGITPNIPLIPLVIKLYTFYDDLNIIDSSELEKSLKLINDWTFRRSIIRANDKNLNGVIPNILKKLIEKNANVVENKESIYSVLKSIIEDSSEKFVSNEAIKESMKVQNFYKNKTKEFLLMKIEQDMSDLKFVINDDVNVDHIIPRKPSTEKRKEIMSELNIIELERYDEIVNNIGNLALLDKSKNIVKSNSVDDIDKKILFYSDYPSNKKIIAKIKLNKYWNNDDIKSRREFITEKINNIWKTNL
ncbi:MAG: DUF1524 domain-containing protein [Mycoplasmataceae bacterium]|nr:DUF1524 domain-containing protein [Mycoplasmataceae bacterium]